MTDRPNWNFKLTEKQITQLSRRVTKITLHRELTDVDRSRTWIEFHRADRTKMKPPDGWEDFFEFNPDHAGLLRPTYLGRQAVDRLFEINRWEKENSDERAEYERLKKKFGD